jgi:site-specific DNA-methyltransferase (adenine-specific)
MSGILYCGDNLEILREYVPPESVDLVYLDPPFNSQRTYNIVHRDSRARAEAFKDHWSWQEVAPLWSQMLESPKTPRRLASLLRGLHDTLVDEESDLLAYLTMMTARLIEIRAVLKPTGSVYLHCDPTASHYLKLVMDAIFGAGCFRNEVIWRYRRWPAKSRRFQRMHDVLLFYTARPAASHTFNVLYGYERLAESTLKTFGTRKQQADFSSGHRKPSTVDEETKGPPLSDVWEIGVIAPISKERLGYPTQKPLELLDRVIRASSNPGDLVLDPFCGCGTTIEASERLGRRWIGIDIASAAIEIIEERFRRAELATPAIQWHPVGAQAAEALAKRSPRQFEDWVLRKVRAARTTRILPKPPELRKGQHPVAGLAKTTPTRRREPVSVAARGR